MFEGLAGIIKICCYYGLLVKSAFSLSESIDKAIYLQLVSPLTIMHVSPFMSYCVFDLIQSREIVPTVLTSFNYNSALTGFINQAFFNE